MNTPPLTRLISCLRSHKDDIFAAVDASTLLHDPQYKTYFMQHGAVLDDLMHDSSRLVRKVAVSVAVQDLEPFNASSLLSAAIERELDELALEFLKEKLEELYQAHPNESLVRPSLYLVPG